MAEFQEVIRQARRMCERYSSTCEDCPLSDSDYCVISIDLAEFDTCEFESKIMQWAAEHPEPQYPTWEEWQNENFPDAGVRIRPCEFMSEDKWLLNSGCDCVLCDDCYRRRIPAEIAEKLGIKPKEGER